MKAVSTLWRWSPVVTLPASILFLIWGWNTYGHWSNFMLRHPVSEGFTLQKSGILEAQHLRQQAQVMLTPTSPDAAVKASGLDPIHLFIAETAMGELMEELPQSGFAYKDASMFYDGALRPVKARLRGDSVYHWGYWKKSWRVKTDRGALFKGMRKINLIAPRTKEVFNNHLGHRLAQHMGLLAPQSEVVPVSINGRFQGIHILTEQLEESTIRRAGRMPGDLYVGDLAGTDRFSGIQPTLFSHAGTWKKSAINNHFPDESREPIAELLRLIQDPTSARSQEQLSEICDMDAFGRFSAFENLSGSLHYDAHHNWRLYYDPWRNRFEPLVWDPMAWNMSWRSGITSPIRREAIKSPLHVALFSNADFLRARERAFVEFFASGTDERFLREASDIIAAVDPLLDLDADMAQRVRVLTPSQIREATRELLSYVKDSFAKLERIHLRGGAVLAIARIADDGFALRLSGRRQLHRLKLSFDRPLEVSIETRISWKVGKSNEVSEASGYTSQTRNEIIVEAGLLSRVDVIATTMDVEDANRNKIQIRPGYYELELMGLPRQAKVSGVTAECIDGDRFDVSIVDTIAPSELGATQQILPDRPTSQPTIWSGTLRLTGENEVQDLVIEPGTKVLCEPGARLFVRGQLAARGTSDQPIEFLPASPGQEAWGMVALDTPAASGSRLTHCRFVGGSGWKEPLAEYSAMVSIHDVQDVAFANCTFESSRVVDDMVHGVYSEIVFTDCRFINSLSDALDMDISELTLDRCVFEGSGNDAVDLMTTSAVIASCTFTASGDKGVSVGEHSKLLMIQSTVQGCEIGVQVKDESVAFIMNADFVGNRLALDAYKKNWRYDGGGHARVLNCWVEGDKSLLTIDKHSSLFVDGTLLSAEHPEELNPKIQLGDDVLSEIPSTDSRAVETFVIGDVVRKWALGTYQFQRFYIRANPRFRGRSEPVDQ